MQIAAQGILTERVKQGPAGTRSLSFKTKLFAPLGKVGKGPELAECVEKEDVEKKRLFVSDLLQRCQGQSAPCLFDPFDPFLMFRV